MQYKIAHKGKKAVLKELCTIPGIGKSISLDLWHLGIRSIGDLKNKNPETLYKKHCIKIGQKADRCVLYVFRCAVYYASNQRHSSKLLFWWNWKDK